MVKTVELMLGLPSMSIFDLVATDMRASFIDPGTKPDLTPYTATQPQQSLLELNQRVGSINGRSASVRRAAARASARMSFAGPDEAPAEQLNRILWHDAKGWTKPYPTVKHSLFFPPDPGSGRACTLGGMAANNASGPHAVRWGTTSTYVLGAEVVLADGSVITTGGVHSKALKSSSGIDLTKLFVGSEGTLGIFTRLRLRVRPRPPARAVILAGYRALEDTVASLDDLFEAGILPSTAELLDKSAVDALQLWRPELELPEGEAVLFIEVEGTPEQVAANVRYTDGIVRKRATVTRFAEDEKEITRLWAGRSGLAAATALAHPGKHRIFAGEDLAVPLSEIPQTVRRAREMGAELGIAVVFYGHFGDGNVHSAILVDPDDPDEVRRADELADRLHKLAIEVGGTVTGEHGTGAVRARYMRAEHGDALDVMKRIKNVMDPKGLLNPGKLYGP